MTKLTPELLIQLGFRGEGKLKFIDTPTYRLVVPPNDRYGYYHYEFQVNLDLDLPEDNPNSGQVSLYSPPMKDIHVITSYRKTDVDKPKIDVIEWDNDESVGGIQYMDIRETNFRIANHVTTLERLNDIYTALTGNPPLTPRVNPNKKD